MKRNGFKWKDSAGAVLMTAGKWLLKLGAFIVWVCLSAINILLRHILDGLKKWIFPKDKS